MRKEYDFRKALPNPYAKKLKRQITIRLDHSTIEFFQKLAQANEIPYQTLINLYLRECVLSRKKLVFHWTGASPVRSTRARAVEAT